MKIDSDDKVDQNNINFVKKFNLFKSGIADDFDRLKQAFFFFDENRFKEELLESNVVDRPQDMSERLVKQMQDHTECLREELRNENYMITCLSKRDDTIFSYKNQVYNSKQKVERYTYSSIKQLQFS